MICYLRQKKKKSNCSIEKNEHDEMFLKVKTTYKILVVNLVD